MNAIIYAAKSTVDKHGSIPDQLIDCRAMADREGWHVDGEYQDEGFSAYTGNRGPSLAAAKEHAARLADKQGEAVLLVWASDRLARGAGDAPGASASLMEVFHELARRKVRIRSVKDDGMLTNSLLIAFAAWRGNEESRVKGERVKAGARRRAERGYLNGGPAPYGYEHAFDPETGRRRLTIVPTEAIIVQRIYAEFLCGQSQKAIARGLVADGIPTKRGTVWTQSQVGKILRNPLYRGHLLLNGETFRAEHEPIVDAETWARAETLRDASARTKGKGRGRLPIRHLFTRGMLRCGRCDAAMVPRTIRARSKSGSDSESYLCSTRIRDVNACEQTPVPRAAVDEAVFGYFEAVVVDMDATRAALAGRLDAEQEHAHVLLAEAEREVQRATETVERVSRDYKRGALSAESYNHLWPEVMEELAAAEAEVERRRQRLEEIAEAFSFEDVEDDIVMRLSQLRATIAGRISDAAGVESVRAALLELFDGFVLVAGAPTDSDRLNDDDVVVTGKGGRFRYEDLLDRYRRSRPDEVPSLAFAAGGRYALLPLVRPSVIEGFDEDVFPILRRVALDLSETKQSSACRFSTRRRHPCFTASAGMRNASRRPSRPDQANPVGQACARRATLPVAA
jgi:site-specific DNA recombinase